MNKKIILLVGLACTMVGFSYGQATQTAKKGSTATPIACVGDPLHPIIGTTYEYTAIADAAHAGGKYHFFATNLTEFVTNGALNTTGAYTDGSQLFVKSGTYNLEEDTGKISLSWSSSSGSKSFLVVKYTDDDNCKNDNLKVFKIEPKNAFSIEWRNIKDIAKPLDSTNFVKDVVDVCLSSVKSATYNTTEDKMEYDYGEQPLYYELIASNYDKSFKPSFKVSGLDQSQEAELYWGYSKDDISNKVTGDLSTKVELQEIVADSGADPKEGVSIYLKLVVKNKTHEGIADQEITIAADATTGANSIKDVKTDCSGDETDFGKTIIQKLKARPEITAAGGLNFIPAKN